MSAADRTVPPTWSIAELIALLEQAYPPATAQSWDQVGLSLGDPEQRVESVLLTVDVTGAVVAEAVERGVNLIISHHPLLLKGIHAVRTDQPKGRLIAELITNEIALYTAHTNADIAANGTAAALATALGLSRTRPLVTVPIRRLDKIVVFVPDDHAEGVRTAMADAGAGAIGDYDRCAFSTTGTGTFRPLPGAQPFVGTIDEVERVAETRVEMIMDRSLRSKVESALLTTHPYETPAYDITEVVDTSAPSTGMGRTGEIEPCSLAEFAELVAARVPCRAGSVRVAGAADRVVHRVALQAGAGDDLFDEARAAGADVYLTSDLRHHPASEALEWSDAPALIDIPHASAESLWLPGLRDLVLAGLGADTGADRPAPSVVVSEVITDPWTFYR